MEQTGYRKQLWVTVKVAQLIESGSAVARCSDASSLLHKSQANTGRHCHPIFARKIVVRSVYHVHIVELSEFLRAAETHHRAVVLGARSYFRMLR